MADNTEIKALQPAQVWTHFAGINAIPRASKKEDQISAYMEAFGKGLNLETQRDVAGNILIKKPATQGMENRQTIVMQSHIDMVHQKNNDTDFDFATQGIDMYIDGDWVKAKGTTLGADNGLGVASIMAILESIDIAHPAIEALFTVDEETGMTGAKALQPGFLSGSILLNLDTEDDDELTIGCAGGIDVTASGKYLEVNHQRSAAYAIKLTGATGGHSGGDIHLGRANANKLMNRLLHSLIHEAGIEVASVEGGSLRNAIPRESTAIVVADDEAKLKTMVEELTRIVKEEYSLTDPDLEITLTKTDMPNAVAASEDVLNFVHALYAMPNGIYRMTPGIENLVQTSNNIAKVSFKAGEWQVQNLTRSSVDSEKMDLVNTLHAAAKIAGGEVNTGSDYPGWKPLPDSPVVALMEKLYTDIFKDKMHVNAIHAGLECGIIGAHYPHMQMVSFGPTIKGAHSPDERASISSFQKFWAYMLEVLKHIPEKK